MDSSLEKVVPWGSSGARPLSLCERLGSAPPPSGVIPTVVVASMSGICQDQPSEHKGVVFYGSDPVAWYCLSDAEAVAFKIWAISEFPSVQIVTAKASPLSINCPPPKLSATNLPQETVVRARLEEALGEIEQALRDLAPQWFVPATPIEAAKRVA
jgi:hypothetical protein